MRLSDVGAYTPEKELADELIEVQAATLRLCAARGDLFTVLALPAHYREDDALAHVARLKTAVADDRTLSFGALYHPWLTVREASGGGVGASDTAFRTVPPEGAVCGMIARRAIARGAWVAPANETLLGPVALSPRLALERRLDLQEGEVNLVRQEPRRFVTYSAVTLSDDPDLRDIQTRRLLILLRRLALRLGTTYVFEPHDAAFRRLVQRGFEGLLGDLFARGAFAGATPAEAFRVETGPAVNPPPSVDLGRFIVELRVAPARPLTFLTVRLVRTGDRTLVTQD